MSEKPKRTLRYDGKLRGLTVEVSKEDLASFAQTLCEEHQRLDLLEKRINHVWYCPPVDSEEEKRQFHRDVALSLAIWLLGGMLVLLGILKLAELVRQWIT